MQLVLHFPACHSCYLQLLCLMLLLVRPALAGLLLLYDPAVLAPL
jgi:hypothetical protein